MPDGLLTLEDLETRGSKQIKWKFDNDKTSSLFSSWKGKDKASPWKAPEELSKDLKIVTVRQYIANLPAYKAFIAKLSAKDRSAKFYTLINLRKTKKWRDSTGKRKKMIENLCAEQVMEDRCIAGISYDEDNVPITEDETGWVGDDGLYHWCTTDKKKT